MTKTMFSRLWLIAAMLSVAYSASAFDAKVDGIYYNLNANTATASVTYGDADYSGEVTIPAEIIADGAKYSITSIGEDAFYYCTGLTSVTIPNSVKTIVAGAFYGCSGLTSLTIPNSVTTIGEQAFCGCIELISLTIPDSVTEIGVDAFLGTAWFINQPDGLVYIGKILYQYKGNMPDNTSIAINDGTIRINGMAFYGCSGLSSVTIPNSVTSIGSYAFDGCSGLTSVTIPESVTAIQDGVFGGCTGLTSLPIHNSITSIGESTFNGCTGLTSVVIPTSVTSIGECAFSNCSGITSLTIPNSVTEIGGEAFSECVGLTSVTIPNSVTAINYGVFYGCTGLTSVTIPNSVTTIGDYAFEECTGLTSVAIPNSVTLICDYAFNGCSRITKITIPKSVRYIGYEAFACNDKLEVYVEWDNLSPELMSFDEQPFSDNIFQQGTLYVPTGSKALYEQTEPWKNFMNIVEYTVDGIEEIEAEGGVTIGVEGGKIVVNGAGDAKVKVFGTNGAAVYSGAADNLPELAAGIYIVRVGSTVKKVAVAQ